MSFVDSFKMGLRPSPLLTVSEWADQFRMLPATSAEKGRYRTSRTPYLKEPMDCLSLHSPVRVVVIKKPTQVGATEAGNNFLFYVADIAPGPCMMVFPTTELAKRHSKTKVATSLREMPWLHAKIRDVNARGGDSIFIKEFPGGFWTFMGSNSPAIFRSASIQILILDDEDGYEADVGGEGDPGDLAKKRTDSFSATCKWLLMSTPTVKGLSRVDNDYSITDQCEYYVPCPHCDEMQPLVWGGTGFDHGVKFSHKHKSVQVSDAWYLCRKCHKRIDEHNKPFMLEHGVWVPKYPEITLYRGFQLNSMYSPLGWVTWKKIAMEFLEAKKKPEKLKVWVNTRLGLSFEVEGEQPNWVAIKSRAGGYRLNTVPQGGLFLVAGVDVQLNRLAVIILAFGREEECWVIFYGEIFGDTAKPQVWKELDELRNKPFPHSSGIDLRIGCTAVDSGDQTQLVYNYVKPRAPRVIAVKGSSIRGKQIIGRPTMQDVTSPNGRITKGAVELYAIGTDTAKYLIYSRVQLKDELKTGLPTSTAMIHTPTGLDDDFYEQFVSERLTTRYVKGFPVKEWVLPSGSRNEVLDITVYAYAAAIHAGLYRLDWHRLEQDIGDLLKAKTIPEPSPTPISVTKPKQNPNSVKSKYLSNMTRR